MCTKTTKNSCVLLVKYFKLKDQLISIYHDSSVPTNASIQTTATASGPRLLADIGGTNARFALETAAGKIEAIEVLACAAYPTLAAALVAYLASPAVAATGVAGIRHGAIAIANPVTGDLVRMTNHHWEFSIEALRREVNFETLVVVNDFTALASSLPQLSASRSIR
jgi:glucokinase